MTGRLPSRRCADLSNLWPSISASKMRVTETVVLFDADVFGDFARLCVGGLAKFLSVCGKHLAGVGEISVNGAARGGINGQNLPILSVFRMLFVCFCMFLCTYIGANDRGPRIGKGKARGELVHSQVPPPRRTRDLHLRDEDLSLHPSEQKSFVGDPESLGAPDLGRPADTSVR